MTEGNFISLIEQLDNASWQAVIDGQCLALVDDIRIETGSDDRSDKIYCAPASSVSEISMLKDEVLANAAELLASYYLTHPLTLKGFNRQLELLIEANSELDFAAVPGQLPKYTLFVDVGEVQLENKDSPRQRYGVYCELDRLLAESKIVARVRKWLASGEAYEQYLAMNVCRYNC